MAPPVFFDELIPPKRRDLGAIKQMLAEIGPGSSIEALFSTDRYGTFSIVGSAVTGSATGYMLGGRSLGSETSVDGSLRRLSLVGAEKIDSLAESCERGGIDQISHGDILRATFSAAPYGYFSILGIATESDHDSFVLVGDWIIRYDGIAATRLVAVARVARAGEHAHGSPQRRPRLASEVVESGP